MNKQIRDLAAQANIEMEDGNYSLVSVEELTQFAELIVRECAEVSENDVTDGDACCTNTADRIARQIRKHFGIEK